MNTFTIGTLVALAWLVTMLGVQYLKVQHLKRLTRPRFAGCPAHEWAAYFQRVFQVYGEDGMRSALTAAMDFYPSDVVRTSQGYRIAFAKLRDQGAIG